MDILISTLTLDKKRLLRKSPKLYNIIQLSVFNSIFFRYSEGNLLLKEAIEVMRRDVFSYRFGDRPEIEDVAVYLLASTEGDKDPLPEVGTAVVYPES